MQDPSEVGIVKSAEQFVTWSGDLQDTESVKIVQIVYQLQQKWASRPNTAANLEALRDEALTKLAEINVLATFDPAPCFHGEPPIVEIIGKIAGDPQHEHGFDHEKKMFEVRKATQRGEKFLGEKEQSDSTSAKKRARRERRGKRASS